MGHLSPETFDENARAALADDQLRGALRRATTLFSEKRLEAISAVSNWEALRERARAIKEETLLNLERYLLEFERNAERAGAQVHWARDAAEACDLISRIALERGARTVVKGKSMATEEIELNAALAAHGVEAIETDLGEYIIQLAHETPSHIIAPAIHKTRHQISDLFADKLGVDPTERIEDLTRTARQVLRERFIRADLGVSGVNFGIAETGSIFLVENEGNIRLTTSVPKTHVAVMGIEKVIPRLEDLDVFLRLLPRSASGQRLSAYKSLLTGAKRRSEDEGPDEVHIVLFDNGRTRMLAHPVTRQSLACIRCGACLNACPVYQQVGGHAYGSVYPGPIGAVITPLLKGPGKADQLPFASSLCGACREVCPVKIDIPQLLLHLRAEITGSVPAAGSNVTGERFKRRPGERIAFWLFARVMERPWLYKLTSRFMRLAQHALVRDGKIVDSDLLSQIPAPLQAWTQARDMRPLAARSFRQQWADGLDTKGKGK